ncbi:MAG: phage holin family protein [Chloroflexi bacterium]|nr:phage holin family protein [Chloroflexota bacterium]
MRRIILRWAIISVGVLAAAYWLPQYVSYRDWRSVIAFAAILGVLNAFVRPVVKLLTCPLQIITFGLFTFVVNALIFWLASSFPVGVHVQGFVGAFLGALVVSVISFVAGLIIPPRKKNGR